MNEELKKELLAALEDYLRFLYLFARLSGDKETIEKGQNTIVLIEKLNQ